ncbi:MAG: ferritin-like domain-containing protein [Acidimicrobiia bacterium]
MIVDRRGFLATLAGGLRGAADQALDVQMLQTAASVENVLVSAYDTILGLPSFTAPTANGVVKNLLTTARDQHTQHAAACNELAQALGGRAQTGANAFLSGAVTRARSTLGDLASAVELALELEQTSAQTYQFDLGLLADVNARRMAASVMGVECQHVGMLRPLRHLLAARTPEMVSFDTGTALRLPREAGTVGFPEAFAKHDKARPASDGAVA